MQRGEIYVADLGPAVGSERGGTRPVVVVSHNLYNAHPHLVAVIIGEDAANVSAQAGVLVTAAESGAAFDIVFLSHQVRTVDPIRLTTSAIGTVPGVLLARIGQALRNFLDL